MTTFKPHTERSVTLLLYPVNLTVIGLSRKRSPLRTKWEFFLLKIWSFALAYMQYTYAVHTRYLGEGGGKAAVKNLNCSWRGSFELQFLDCSHPPEISSWSAVGKIWTAEVELQFLDCRHSPLLRLQKR